MLPSRSRVLRCILRKSPLRKNRGVPSLEIRKPISCRSRLGRVQADSQELFAFFEKRALPAFLFVYYKSTTSPAAFILKPFHLTLSSPTSARAKGPRSTIFFHVFGFFGNDSLAYHGRFLNAFFPQSSSNMRKFLSGIPDMRLSDIRWK